jgi:hypothetical protein
MMTAKEKIVLNNIVNGMENLAVSLDAFEEALIRRGQLTTGEIDALAPNHAPNVASKLVALRSAIAAL